MNWEIREHQLFGKSLFANNGTVEIGIPLLYGLRIGHLSFCGGENLFFEQPLDMTDLTTPEGFRLRGGHRLWVAPEGDDVYYPDNDPIHYEVVDDEIRIWQNVDPWLQIEKCMCISFASDNQVRVLHKVKNVGDKECCRTPWTISVMDAGGVEYIPIGNNPNPMAPRCHVTWWSHTTLGDPRANYKKDVIEITHMPIEDRYKIGVGHPAGPVQYVNKGVIFEKSFLIDPNLEYPDGGMSYETYFCKHMAEVESLAPCRVALPGETLEHEEIWTLRPVE